jgi:hypothetical protein
MNSARFQVNIIRVGAALLAIAAFSLLCSMFAGCSVVPKPVESHSAAFSGNENNSGILGVYVVDGVFQGFIVNQDFVDRYRERIAKYGDQLRPTVLEAGKGITSRFKDYLATKAVMDANVQAALKERGNVPPTPGWQKLLLKWGVL